MKKKLVNLLCISVVLGTLFGFSDHFLCRDLWFDEALTVLNFAALPSIGTIYRNYVIPNNQIVHTVLVHFGLSWMPETSDPTIFLRFMELLLAGATLVSLFGLFKSRFGSGPILTVPLLALASAVPFLVYATAVRGYMLSMLIGVWTLHFALNLMSARGFKSLLGYFLCSYLLLGTIPSNLLVSAAVILYALPLGGEQFYRKKRFWLLLLLPAAAFLLFYGPIFPAFQKVLTLREGWSSWAKVLQSLGTGLAISFAMLLLPALGSAMALERPRFHWQFSSRAMIWLLPIPAALLLPSAPFPRVFIVLWPFYMLLMAGGLRDLTVVNCRLDHRWNGKIWLCALAIIVLGFAGFAARPQTRLAFSRRNGGSSQDDYFYGYYLRESHIPAKTAATLRKFFPHGIANCYLSFASDPWSVMFYCLLNGFSLENFRFDGPRGPVAELPPGTVVILRSEENPEIVEHRFGRKLTRLFQNDNHHIYQAQ